MIRAIRRWARRYTGKGHYSPVGIGFHWLMAALILFQLGWGYHMGRVPVGPEKIDGYRIHAELGLLMLLLAALRAGWRLMVPGPINDADRLGWQTKISHVTHALFYICFFLLPLSGWAMWSALGDGAPLSIAGIVPVPQLPFHEIDTGIQWWILESATNLHAMLVLLLLAMIPVHAGAALKHHFWDKHDVLIGMLPELDADLERADVQGPPALESRPSSEHG